VPALIEIPAYITGNIFLGGENKNIPNFIEH
jgi:hypothetical protein